MFNFANMARIFSRGRGLLFFKELSGGSDCHWADFHTKVPTPFPGRPWFRSCGNTLFFLAVLDVFLAL